MIDQASLSGEHAELSHLAAQLLIQLRKHAPDLTTIPALRWELRRKLSAHLVKEDKFLYPQLQADADPVVSATAKRFADESRTCQAGGMTRDIIARLAISTEESLSKPTGTLKQR